jgi:xylan 1,4-beta-xylosidase
MADILAAIINHMNVNKTIGYLLALFLLLSGVTGCTVPKKEEQPRAYWTNPIRLADEWGDYGLGDPFVFSFNGTYYLYVSTRDTDAGVKVWSSTDLVKWAYQGLCTEDPITTGAYAPEVKYWNGLFYMYTSPGGGGHYILTSESPTGPFQVVTGNLGKSIDGTVFVDDDGSWYFYHAGVNGIEATKMSDPLSFGESIPTGAYMGGWTEGPGVWKRNGLYHMTYTGNHVFSNAYRVDTATSTSPLSGFVSSTNNPVLIRTEGKTVGLGHNSVVTGPDLDSQYMIYHNLEGPGIVGPLRHMNIDAMVWNGDRMSVLGPTSEKQPEPKLPDFFDRFAREKLGSEWKKAGAGQWELDPKGALRLTKASNDPAYVVTKADTESDYTAEYNVRMDSSAGDKAKAGAMFSYKDKDNYGIALLNRKTNTMEVRLVEGGVAGKTFVSELPPQYDLTKWHQLRVEKAGSVFTLFVDGMQKQKLNSSLGGGKVGYVGEGTQATYGYIAFSNYVNGSSAWDLYKPLPGTIQAVHYEKGGEGEAYHDLTPNHANAKYRSGGVDIKEDGDGGYAITQMESGEWLDYRVNVANTGSYDVEFHVAGKVGTKFRVMNGDTDLTGELEIPANGGDTGWVTVIKKGIKAEAGLQTWRLKAISGEMELSAFTVYEHEELVAAVDEFDDKNDFGWTRYEGVWGVSKGALWASSAQPAKTVFGHHMWTDYTMEADIMRKDGEGKAGILVRVSNPANGMERNQNRDDFVQGYYAYLDSQGVHLVKHNYGTERIKDVMLKLPVGQYVHLKVRVSGTVIEVYLGEVAEPLIAYDDRSSNPFMHGSVGFKSVDETTYFDHVKILPNS